jgi:hypothetical protein
MTPKDDAQRSSTGLRCRVGDLVICKVEGHRDDNKLATVLRRADLPAEQRYGEPSWYVESLGSRFFIDHPSGGNYKSRFVNIPDTWLIPLHGDKPDVDMEQSDELPVPRVLANDEGLTR